jgi:hypothetical protein
MANHVWIRFDGSNKIEPRLILFNCLPEPVSARAKGKQVLFNGGEAIAECGANPLPFLRPWCAVHQFCMAENFKVVQ